MVDVYADSSNTSDQMGDLALQLKAAGDADWSTVWQRSGTDSTYDWASKSVALDGYVNQTVQVRWKATAGVGGPRSEIGLDNILVSDSLAALSNVSGRITAETVCEGDSLYAQAVSNGTTSFGYLWSTGDTTSAISLQTTGWYAVSVMDEENCSCPNGQCLYHSKSSAKQLISCERYDSILCWNIRLFNYSCYCRI
jgi:hypothetical protein